MENMMIDLAFEIVTEKEFEDLTQAEILAGLFTRITNLIKQWDEEVFGFCDEYEVTEAGIK